MAVPSAGKGSVLKAVMQAYSYVIIWMSISIGVILFNKVRESAAGSPDVSHLLHWMLRQMWEHDIQCVQAA